MKFLKELFLDGKIPYIMPIKNFLLVVFIIAPFLIFLFPQYSRNFGVIGWYALTGVLLVRPLADIFPDIKIFRTLVLLRREFGLFSGLMVLAHFAGFILNSDRDLFEVITYSNYWNYKNFIFWGLIGILALFPVVLTSNQFSMIKLKRNWKRIQHLSYLFFLFGGVHIYMINKDFGLIPVILVAFFWVLARFKFIISFIKKSDDIENDQDGQDQ